MTLLLGLALLLAPTAAAAAHLFARAMHNASLGQRIRDYGPRLHERKSGTPTMGGVVILLLWGLSLLVTYRFHPLPKEALFVFLSGLLFGGIGFLDDFLSLHHKRSLGLSPLQKVLLSTSLSVVSSSRSLMWQGSPFKFPSRRSPSRFPRPSPSSSSGGSSSRRRTA